MKNKKKEEILRELKGKKLLNLGCGKDIIKGAINVDRYKYEGVDVVHNLEKFPYPFKDNYFDNIYARGVIEHLDNFFGVMKEIHRILKPKGKIYIRVPHFSGSGAYHPFHKTFFCISSFDIIAINKTYAPTLDELNKLFILEKSKIKLYKGFWFLNYLLEPIFNKIPLHYERSFLKSLFPATEIEIFLTKPK